MNLSDEIALKTEEFYLLLNLSEINHGARKLHSTCVKIRS